MKKNLIAVAVSAALVAVPATSALAGDLTVYGQAQVEISSTEHKEDNTDKKTTVDVIDNARGRIGFKATEDLGGKLKGIAKFEFKADTADGDASSKTADVALTKRELMVGLKGVFGTFDFGRLKTPYKYNGGVRYDPLVTTQLEARGTAGMSGKVGNGNSFGHNGFQSNSMGWRSPKWGPVKLQAIYGPETDDNSYSVSVNVNLPVFEVFLAANDNGKLDRPGNTDDSNYQAWKLGAELRLGGGNHKIALQYEDTKDETTGSELGRDPSHFFLGYNGKFGKTTFVAQGGLADYGKVKDSTAEVDEAYKQTYFALAAIYKFSKSTRVYGGLKLEEDDQKTKNRKDTVWTIGLRKDFKS